MKVVFFVILNLCLLFPVEILSQSNNSKISAKHKFSKMESTRLALNLAQYGYENKNAISLITSAEILIKNKINNLHIDKTFENKLEEETKNYDNVITMLKLAKKFANGDKNLIALADNVEFGAFALQSSRGVIGGAKVGNHRLPPNSTNSFWVVFKANELAEISVIGTGKNVIELYVFDEKDNLIKKDTRHKAECYVSWQPQIRSAYKIEVKNKGNSEINYSITTN